MSGIQSRDGARHYGGRQVAPAPGYSWMFMGVVMIFVGIVTVVYYKRRPRGGRPPVRHVTTTPGAPKPSPKDVLLTAQYATWSVAVDIDAFVSRTSVADTTVQFKEGCKNLLKTMASISNLYVYCHVSDPGTTPVEQHAPAKALLAILKPLATEASLKREQVLFCTVEKSHEAFSRQLTPSLLITTRPAIAKVLKKHIPYIILVAHDLNLGPELTTESNVSVVRLNEIVSV